MRPFCVQPGAPQTATEAEAACSGFIPILTAVSCRSVNGLLFILCSRRTSRNWHRSLEKRRSRVPVKSYTELLLQPWQFAEVDRAPHPPRKEPRHIEPKYVGNASAMTDAGKLADSLEVELSEFTTLCVGKDVLGDCLALPQSVLGSRRANLAIAEIWYKSAISERPHSRPIGNRQL